jgi:hypothetical protein
METSVLVDGDRDGTEQTTNESRGLDERLMILRYRP